ncbi:uncharacterized protein BDR25DRAFT_354931 [Lindgomyces ingoldianus]|uniref:Uncharacterized protein n=1 Tax=Lindgomyces ingoldianus TaxID=673940 RepID=A0ACB6QY64_9PLEO|nr:uncharacterized protein BDR25DRAFT_354931 [Lindgomyces ingoldianus]KAF2471020.1 hypothetical protein BDR25DRAFT_354931 [Lindgomyces ingoldianus]
MYYNSAKESEEIECGESPMELGYKQWNKRLLLGSDAQTYTLQQLQMMHLSHPGGACSWRRAWACGLQMTAAAGQPAPALHRHYTQMGQIHAFGTSKVSALCEASINSDPDAIVSVLRIVVVPNLGRINETICQRRTPSTMYVKYTRFLARHMDIACT